MAWWGSEWVRSRAAGSPRVLHGTSLLFPGVEWGFVTPTALLIYPFFSAAVEFTQAGKSVEAKIYDTLQWQVTRSAREPCRGVPVVPGWAAVTWVKSAGLPFFCLPSRSGPCCLASAPTPRMCWGPSRGWPARWAWPSVSVQTSAPPCARPCAPSSTKAARQVGGETDPCGGSLSPAVTWKGEVLICNPLSSSP